MGETGLTAARSWQKGRAGQGRSGQVRGVACTRPTPVGTGWKAHVLSPPPSTPPTRPGASLFLHYCTPLHHHAGSLSINCRD